MSDLLDRVDALDAALASNPQLNADRIRTRRAELANLRHAIANDLTTAAGVVETVHGAKVTHRPDVALTEAQRQAADQGAADGGYLPVHRATMAAGGTVQQPAPETPAELAKTGAVTR